MAVVAVPAGMLSDWAPLETLLLLEGPRVESPLSGITSAVT